MFSMRPKVYFAHTLLSKQLINDSSQRLAPLNGYLPYSLDDQRNRLVKSGRKDMPFGG